MKRKLIAGGIALVCVAAIIAGYFLTASPPAQKKQPLKEAKIERLAFKYPKQYLSQQTPQSQPGQAQTLKKLRIADPLSIIEVTKEAGAIQGANITRSNFLDYLEKNANSTFPVRFPDFKRVGTERLKLSGRDVARIAFSYTGTDKKTTLYFYFFIIPLDNDAYYVAIQSADKELATDSAVTVQESMRIF